MSLDLLDDQAFKFLAVDILGWTWCPADTPAAEPQYSSRPILSDSSFLALPVRGPEHLLVNLA